MQTGHGWNSYYINVPGVTVGCVVHVLYDDPVRSFLTAAHFCLIKAKKLLFEEHAPQKVKNIQCEEQVTLKGKGCSSQL